MKHWSDEVSYFPSEGCWLPSRAGISPIEMSLAAVFNSIHRKLGWFIQFIEAVFSGDIQHARKKSLLVLIYLTWGGNMRETFPSWQVASKLLQGHPLCFKPLVITVQCVCCQHANPKSSYAKLQADHPVLLIFLFFLALSLTNYF